jgi:hypothetical protein
MHLVLAISPSALFFFYALAYVCRAQAEKNSTLLPSFSSSSSSRQPKLWKAPSMEIEQRAEFQVDGVGTRIEKN